jgi:tetratricopeptide (TPR) repeat protein
MSTEKSTSQVAYELLQEAYNEFDANNYSAALQFCQAALAIYEGVGDQVGIGCTLTNIGNIYKKQAVEFYEQALSNFENNNIQNGEDTKQISEEITQTLNSSLETQVIWYVSEQINTTKPTPLTSKSPRGFILYRRTRAVIEFGSDLLLESDGQLDGGGRPPSGRGRRRRRLSSDGQPDGGGRP